MAHPHQKADSSPIQARPSTSEISTTTTTRTSPDGPETSNMAGNATPPKTELLDLPAELRNNIWEYALSDPEPIRLTWSMVSGLSRVKQPALTAVSRQVRTESLAIFYHSNVFQAIRFSSITEFLRSLDQKQVKHLHHLRYDCTFRYLTDIEPTLKNMETDLKTMGFRGTLKAKISFSGMKRWDAQTSIWVALQDLKGYWQAENPRIWDRIHKRTEGEE